MKPKIKILFFVLVLGLLTFAAGCNQQSDAEPQTGGQVAVELQKATPAIETRTPIEATGTQELVITNTQIQQPSETAALPTATPIDLPTNTSTIESITPQIPTLNFCRASDDVICIGSFLSISDQLGMVFLAPDNQDESFIKFDGEAYNCAAVPGYSDRYYCGGLPGISNKTIMIEIYFAGSETPTAAGAVFIPNDISQPTPTAVPKPPDPYSP